ncbi:MAG TPA: dephospho-CoA kinase [Bacilli bacterium]|nr:dephospho-CoA kinase [Bacilli bacterium]
MVIGITGSIATGKTQIEKIIKAKGYQVIDADDLSHQALFRGTEVYYKTIATFGETILNKDLSINRRKLGEVVFRDPSQRIILEDFIHPYVKGKIAEAITKAAKSEFLFISVPLLYETKMENLFDYIIVVYVSKAKQLERLIKRDKIDEDLALIKISSQLSLDVKKKKADFVIDNEVDGLQQLEWEIDILLDKIKEKANEI